MFVDQKLVVSLEYIFYQNDEKYVRIKPEKKIDKEDDFNTKPFGTFQYTDKLLEKHPLSIYTDQPIDFVENKTKKGKVIEYLTEH